MHTEKIFWFAFLIIAIFLIAVGFSAMNNGGAPSTALASAGKKAYINGESLLFYAMLFLACLIALFVLKYFFFLFEREERTVKKK